MADSVPDAPAAELLTAFLKVHARGDVPSSVLYPRGESLHRRLASSPPASADWGRFLIALGELAAEGLHDDRAASRWFLAALESVRQHGDSDVGATAGYDQGVLHERRGDRQRAAAAYHAAADAGMRAGASSAAPLRAACALVRLAWENHDALTAEQRALLKRAWLDWLRQRHSGGDPLPPDVNDTCGRLLAALLLPEDDPTTLAARWRAWPPHHADADPTWMDGDPRCLGELYRAAAQAAQAHLADEGGDPAAPYRLLGEALRRG